MLNLKDITSRKAYKQFLSLLMVMAIIFSVLPCNCMAGSEVPEKQSSENHPCHSSESEEIPVDDNSSHKNCCCTDTSFLSASDLDTVKIDNQENLTKKLKVNYVLNSFVSINTLDSTKLIRGSPPTTDILTSLSSNLLPFLQRWLI